MGCETASFEAGHFWGRDRCWSVLAEDGVSGGGVLGDSVGHLGELALLVAGVAAQQPERLVHVEPAPFGDDPFGLLDQDPGVQRGLQLPGDLLVVQRGAALQHGDGGHGGQGLGDREVVGCEPVPSLVPKRLHAPIVWPRHCSGTACTR